MKVLDLFQIYIDQKSQSLTCSTLRSLRSNYDNHIDPAFGQKDFTMLRYIDYQKFANNLLANGLKPKTVKNVLLLISGLYHTAKINELYEGENWVSLVELPKFDNKQYFTINRELQVRYIKAILDFDEPVYRDIFIFLLHGRRLSEVLNLKWEFVDMSEKIIYLPATHNKSKKNLAFEMTYIQQKILRRYLKSAVIDQDTVFPTGHIFYNPFTKKRYADVRKPFARLLKRAGLPKIRIHDIRHLVATYLINELELPVEQVSHLLGHSDITITQRYINPKPASAKKAMDVLFDSIGVNNEQDIQDHNDTQSTQKILFSS